MEQISAPAATASSPATVTSSNGKAGEVDTVIRKAQSLMWQHVGVVRDGRALQQVVPELRELQSQLPKTGDRRSKEAANILQTGLLIARADFANAGLLFHLHRLFDRQHQRFLRPLLDILLPPERASRLADPVSLVEAIRTMVASPVQRP